MNKFFTALEPVTDVVELQFTIKSKGGVMSVIVMPKFAVNDPGLGKIGHLSLSGPAADFDESFLATIIQPFEQVAGIVSNVEAFEQARTTAEKETNAAKAEQEVAKNKREAAQKQYKSSLETAERLVADKDYKNALVHLNKALEAAEPKDFVLRRIKEVEALNGKGSLFGGPVEEEVEEVVAVGSGQLAVGGDDATGDDDGPDGADEQGDEGEGDAENE